MRPALFSMSGRNGNPIASPFHYAGDRFCLLWKNYHASGPPRWSQPDKSLFPDKTRSTNFIIPSGNHFLRWFISLWYHPATASVLFFCIIKNQSPKGPAQTHWSLRLPATKVIPASSPNPGVRQKHNQKKCGGR